MAAASYTNAPSGPADDAHGCTAIRSRCNQLGKQSGELLRLLGRQPRAEVLLDAGRIDRPHLAAQLPALGGDEQHVAAAVLRALAPLDQPILFQAIERLLATPMISPRLPCISVPLATAVSAPGPVMCPNPF